MFKEFVTIRGTYSVKFSLGVTVFYNGIHNLNLWQVKGKIIIMYILIFLIQAAEARKTGFEG